MDNRGYTYNVKRCRGNKTDWQCTVQPKVSLFLIYNFITKRRAIDGEKLTPCEVRKLIPCKRSVNGSVKHRK